MPLGIDGVFHFDRQISKVTWAPNVVALLPGSDPLLKNQFIVVTAHLDGLGRNPNAPPGPASIFNGADDNAFGVAALIQIAKAMSEGVRPKRSVIFVAVSGEELGLWGSDYFAARPPVAHGSIVANLNLDMVGRATNDTLYLTGQSNRVWQWTLFVQSVTRRHGGSRLRLARAQRLAILTSGFQGMDFRKELRWLSAAHQCSENKKHDDYDQNDSYHIDNEKL